MSDQPNERDTTFVEVGKTGRAHGIDGEIRVFTAEPDWEYFQPGHVLHLERRDGREPFVLDSWRVAAKFAIAKFESVEDRTAAERLTNSVVYVESAALPELEDEDFYHYEIEGRDVYLERERPGEDSGPGPELGPMDRIGTVDGFFETGANDIMVVLLESGDELYVPMFEGAIAEIERESDRVVLRPLEEWAPEGTEI